MFAISETFTLNNGWKNLLAQAVADGYLGGALAFITVMNFNATVAYLHFHNSSTTNPTTAADGLPLSNDTTVGPGSVYSTPVRVDLSKVWIHTAGNQSIKYSIID